MTDIKPWVDRVQESAKHGYPMSHEYALLAEVAELRAENQSLKIALAKAQLRSSITVPGPNDDMLPEENGNW